MMLESGAIDRTRHYRNGVTMIELIVSAVVLMTVMTFVTTLCFQINQTWKQIAQQRIATGELANQLESITRLTRTEAEHAIKQMQPSEACATVLVRPTLTGELVDDELGTRVRLQINWQRRFPGQPLELCGWLIESSKPDNAAKKDEAAKEDKTASDEDSSNKEQQ